MNPKLILRTIRKASFTKVNLIQVAKELKPHILIIIDMWVSKVSIFFPILPQLWVSSSFPLSPSIQSEGPREE